MLKTTVKLGLMPPLTGLVGIYGPEIVRAGQIACQEVNAQGGVLGRPLELVIEDDGSLPESSVLAANRLLDQHGCVAIIGNLLSNSRIAVAYQVAEPRRIPYLNFSFYEGSILSRYFFHFAALPNQQIDMMIPAMRKRYGPRMFFAGNNYEWPRGSIDAAKRVLIQTGGEIVGEEYCPIGVTSADIESLLDRVAAAAPDVFVPYFAGQDQLLLLSRFTERGMKRRMAVVMGHYDEMMASQLPPAVREGFFSSNTYFMTADTPANRKILTQLAACPGVDGLWPEGNGILTNFGEGVYVCVQAFAQAANQAGSLDAEALVDALSTIRLTAPQGAVRMDPVTHHAQVNTYLARCQADGSFTLIKSFGAMEPMLPERYQHLRVSPAATQEADIRLQARMLEQMSEAVLLFRTDNTAVVYANPGAERMFGYATGELIGLPLQALGAPPTATSPAGSITDSLEALSRKGFWQGEFRNCRKDGSPFWSSASVSAFTHPIHGEVWLWVQKDITQMKSLQEELLRHRFNLEELVAERTAELARAAENTHQFVKLAPISMAMFDRDMRYLATSDRWLAENGRGHTDLVGGLHYELHPDLPATWKQAHQQGLAGAIVKNDEDLWLQADGSCRWLRWAVVPWKHPNGAIGGIIISSEDITDRKLAEEALRAAMADAERANNAKSRFLAAASHDLRQPLSALSIYAGLLKNVSPPSGQQVVANMQDCIASLSELLNDLLDLSKLEAGVVRPCLSDFSIADVLCHLESVHAPEAQEKRLKLRFVGSRLIAHTDAVLFRRILGNLIDNAIRYTQRGGVLIACRRRWGKAWVEVRDSGIGIPADQTTVIFEEFKQLGDSARNNGSGLGLAIVAKTAALLGLEISVRSRPGKGSVFAIELPLGNSDFSRPSPTPPAAASQPLRIALVEDNPMVREALVAGLQGLGHQVVAAATKASLLSGLDARPPDIVVSDYRLTQGETGFDVITAVREKYGAALPAILITGDTDPKLLRSMMERDIVVLHKPLDMTTLQAFLEDLTCPDAQAQAPTGAGVDSGTPGEARGFPSSP